MTRRFTLLCIRGKFWHSACYPWLWTRVYCGSLCICQGASILVPYRIRIDLQIQITVRCRTTMV